MLIPFENMPDHARVWVYQTDRKLLDSEVKTAQVALNEQISQWAAHGAPLAGSVEILHNRFVIIAADELQNANSGCSIDASTNWLKNIGNQLGINFFDRSIAFMEGNEVQTVQLLELKKAVSDLIIAPETIIFNNLVDNIAGFKQNWKQKAIESWLKKYFTIQLA
jgi:hypothetical protein